MGVDLVICVHKDDLKKLLDLENKYFSWHDFFFLTNFAVTRWHAFEKTFFLENYEEKDIYREGITSKELLMHLAKINKHIENREVWVEILSKYNLLFIPDDKEVDYDEWIDLVLSILL